MNLRKWEYIARRWEELNPDDTYWISICKNFDEFLKVHYPGHTEEWAALSEEELAGYELIELVCSAGWCSACEAHECRWQEQYSEDDWQWETHRDCSVCKFAQAFGACDDSESLFSELVKELKRRRKEKEKWIKKS